MDAASDAARVRIHLLGAARATWPALVAIGLAGAAYVVFMPPGLPYDEPAHWLNVLWWLDHWAMPTIGDPGTSYEAQMGPVAYVVYAVFVGPIVRCGAMRLPLRGASSRCCPTCHVGARRGGGGSTALKPHVGIGTLVVLAVGLNPMLLAVSTSVQNDTLSLLLGAIALLVAMEPARRPNASVVLAGVLLGLAILTKVTVWPIAIGLAAVFLVRRRLVHLAILALVSIAVSGWWFVRNLVLYGDLTGRAGVEAAGYEFPPLDASPLSLAQHAVTYLWLPTEYVRNVIVSPLSSMDWCSCSQRSPASG